MTDEKFAQSRLEGKAVIRPAAPAAASVSDDNTYSYDDDDLGAGYDAGADGDPVERSDNGAGDPPVTKPVGALFWLGAAALGVLVLSQTGPSKVSGIGRRKRNRFRHRHL